MRTVSIEDMNAAVRHAAVKRYLRSAETSARGRMPAAHVASVGDGHDRPGHERHPSLLASRRRGAGRESLSRDQSDRHPGNEPLFVSIVVLCEVLWVLEAAYEYHKAELVTVLDQLLETNGVEIEQRDLVRAALDDYRANKADFSDCLIGRTNEAHGCRHTLTFERPLKALDTFRVL